MTTPFQEPAPLQPLPPRAGETLGPEPPRAASGLRAEAGTAPPRAPSSRMTATAQDARPQGSVPQAAGGGTLFTRMTGLFRQRGGAQTDPRPADPRSADPRQSEARQAAPQAAAVPQADTGAELLPQAGSNGSERIDLEIPTFLRRQHPGNNVH